MIISANYSHNVLSSIEILDHFDKMVSNRHRKYHLLCLIALALRFPGRVAYTKFQFKVSLI